MMKDYYETKDKQITPFLLTQSDIVFLGTEIVGQILYFKFSPLDKCQKLVNDFIARKAPLVQPKDLLDALESYRDQVFQMKDKRKNYETKYTGNN